MGISLAFKSKTSRLSMSVYTYIKTLSNLLSETVAFEYSNIRMCFKIHGENVFKKENVVFEYTSTF